MKIWIHVNGNQEGPFEEHTLPLSRMNAQTPVWYEGLTYWTPAISAPVTSVLIKAYLAGQPIPTKDQDQTRSSGPIDVEVVETSEASESSEAEDSREQAESPRGQDGSSREQAEAPSQPQTHTQPRYQQPQNAYRAINHAYSAPAGYQQKQQCTNEPQKQPPTYLVWSIILTILCCNPIGIVAIVLGSGVNSKYYNYDYEGARRRSELTAWWLIITIVTSLIMAPFSILVNL